MSGVWTVVVTYNRRDLLRRSLAAVAAQARPPDRTLVVDNASTDGTAVMLDREFGHLDRLTLARNEGGAGGFHEGIKRAHAGGADWIWLMDDDTIPTPGALAELLAAADRLEPRPLVLASRVLWSDGTPHPMNVPTLERRRMELVVAAAQRRALPIRSATFVSLLLHRGAVDRHGLPLKHFFLWSDDIEYTSRVVLGGGGAYFVPASVVAHETAAPVDFRSAAPGRFYFHVRNTLLTARSPGRPARDRLLRVWILLGTSAAYVLRRRSRASAIAVLRGVWDGVRGVPAPPP